MMQAVRGDLPSGTVTFLFTDVEGSTQLLHELGAEAYAEALAEHRRLIREAFAAPRRRRGRHAGRRLLLRVPDGAGRGGGGARRRRGARHGPDPACAWVCTPGTPHVDRRGLRRRRRPPRLRASRPPATAARSCSRRRPRLLVDGRRSSISASTGSRTSRSRVAIFQLGDERFPPLKTISNTNLPQAGELVRRPRATSSPRSLACFADGARLLTLTGPGGTGKTRLAIEAAADLVPELQGRRVLGRRSPRCATRRWSRETIAQTLGAKDGLAEHIGERGDAARARQPRAGGRRGAGAGRAARRACPNLSCSSPAASRCASGRGRVPGAAARRAGGGRALLRARAATRSRRGRSPSSAARLDNLPLAVELAAARAKRSRPAQILERLAQRLDLLKGGRDADPRQQTLRATIEWSYDLLERRRAAALRAPRGLRRRLHARGGRGGRGRRPRHLAVARRQEPRALHGRALLDARDDPRVRVERLAAGRATKYRFGGGTPSSSSSSRRPSG